MQCFPSASTRGAPADICLWHSCCMCSNRLQNWHLCLFLAFPFGLFLPLCQNRGLSCQKQTTLMASISFLETSSSSYDSKLITETVTSMAATVIPFSVGGSFFVDDLDIQGNMVDFNPFGVPIHHIFMLECFAQSNNQQLNLEKWLMTFCSAVHLALA